MRDLRRLRVQAMRGKRSSTACELGLQPSDVLEQTLRHKADKGESELRILDVKLLNLIVTDLG